MSMPSPPPMVQKRSHEDGPADEHSNVHLSIEDPRNANAIPVSPQSLNLGEKHAGSTLPNGSSRQPSPAPSTASALTSLTATPPPGLPLGTAATGEPPVKKRKLTAAEKEQQRVEKETRLREKEAKKAEREAEKALKDEERRVKNEEKEEKKRQRDLENHKKEQEKEEKRRQKDAEKQRLEEEKQKKERTQPKLGSFFVPSSKPATKTSTPQVLGVTAEIPASPSAAVEDVEVKPSANVLSPQKAKSDYERTFLPWQDPQHSRVAPISHFTWDQEAVEHIQSQFDKLQDSAQSLDLTSRRLRDIFDLFPDELAPRGFVMHLTEHVMRELEGSSEHPLQPSDSTSSLRKPLEVLHSIPIKYLLFDEDVRPPYVGTNTKIRTRADAVQLARNPFKKARDELDYDYDSEAEWEEPEEGEDLDSEGESDSGSEAADEMDDFLDDEDAADGSRPKKRLVAGDMEPIVSGVCFEDERGKCVPVPEAAGFDLASLRLEPLFENATFPIDPFTYTSLVDEPIKSNDGGAMDPPRLPLQPKSNLPLNSFFPSSPSALKPGPKPGPKPLKPARAPSRVLSGEELERFKDAVNGSDLAKVPLLGVLKSQFRKTPNDVLKDTLEAFAQRVGQKRDDKKWVIVEQNTAGY
ncbi:hypothetical protein FH972_024379 [Carpinus fangiana]|uniref:Chromatin assembly factor 1 subunit p150 C-terminal domain-containing protein n=1 Tax=Carpinus fangiana TaxID=176857 RepID=A0A5N6KY67_9ROSI|nr:hypothetical protein FH972_024379 [Carpinus fangiana]